MDPVKALELICVSYRYPDGTVGLENCSLDLKPGETLALLGPNGAGKTTLLMVADGLLRPQSGRIDVFGDPLDGNSAPKGCGKRTGIVFQNADDQVFCPTVFEDVVFGPLNHGFSSEEAHDLAHWALARVGLEGFENRVPQHLSGGEKRKVALATVLSMKPDLLLFDEPTTGLDPKGKNDLMAMLQESEQTLLIATHDFELALRVCDRVALMDGGRVVEVGLPKEILLNESLLEEHGLVRPMWLPFVVSQ
jgi:cobalt/nickel transport system ATP-binding protein